MSELDDILELGERLEEATLTAGRLADELETMNEALHLLGAVGQEMTVALHALARRLEPWQGRDDPDICCICGKNRQAHRNHVERRRDTFRAAPHEDLCPDEAGHGWVVGQTFTPHPIHRKA